MSTTVSPRPPRIRAVAETSPASAELAELLGSTSVRIAWADRGLQFERLLQGAKNAPASLLWSLPEVSDLKERTKFLGSFYGTVTAAKTKQIHAQLAEWLQQPFGNERFAWETLAWQRALLSTMLSLAAKLTLIDRLATIVEEAAALVPCDDPLRFQWLAVELPWLLGSYCREVPAYGEMVRIAQRNLVRFCEECFDDEGIPWGRHLPYLPAIMASWTRCTAAGKVCGEPFIAKHQQALSHAVLRQTLRFTRGDGTGAFTTSAPSLAPWIDLAVALADDQESQLLAKGLLESSKKKPSAGPLVSACSPEGKVAVLRAELSPSAPQLNVAFDGDDVRLELLRNTKLLAGNWKCELRVNGRQLEQSHEWEDVLWHFDEDAVYLELETRFENNWRVQRQIVLPRQDPYIFLADAVLGTEAAELSYGSTYPLAENVSFVAESQTREGWLTQGKNRWLTLPLAAPEWRSERSHYELQAAANGMCYSAARNGRSLYLPLFIMLNPAKGKLEYTWRRLTVGEQLEIQSPDVAVAHRVQVGDLQWISYRALSHRGNRTFLGKNIATEFYLGRFQRDGSVATIMEVE